MKLDRLAPRIGSAVAALVAAIMILPGNAAFTADAATQQTVESSTAQVAPTSPTTPQEETQGDDLPDAEPTSDPAPGAADELSSPEETESPEADDVASDADEVPDDELEAEPTLNPFLDGGARSIAPFSHAQGGSGQYRDIIDWIDWGDANNEIVLQNGQSTKTVTSTRKIGQETLMVTCTASGLQWHQPQQTGENGSNTGQILQPPLVAYTPGSWAGDALDNLYNIGGSGYAVNDNPLFPADFRNPNQMVIGLANPNVGLGAVHDSRRNTVRVTEDEANGANMSFDFACQANLDGVAVPLEGLVFADAEASSSRNYGNTNPLNGPEWVEANTGNQDVTWRILEEQSTCTNAQATATWPSGSGGNTLRLGVNGQECAYDGFTWPNPHPTGNGPMSVAFMEGATSARVGLQGRGYSAVAVGYVLSADFGDAPYGNYGEAGALLQQEWSGGVVPSGGNTNLRRFSKATATLPQRNILGETVDAEPNHQHSEYANGDDVNGIDDEDGLDGSSLQESALSNTHYKLPAEAFNDETFTVSDITCYGPQTGSATVAGWIDWNGDGAFSESDRADVQCGPGKQSVDLTWTVPADATPPGTHTFMRLRIAEDHAEALKSTGISLTGEVEDYRLELPPQLQLIKDFETNYEAPENTNDWTLTAQTGSAATLEFASEETKVVNTGDYTISELYGADRVPVDELAEKTGYQLKHIECSIDDGPVFELTDALEIEAGVSKAVCTLINEDLPGSVVWQKTSTDGETLLSGSEWELKADNSFGTQSVVDNSAPDADNTGGILKIEELPWGTYTLTETAAPAGFKLLDEPATFTVSGADRDHGIDTPMIFVNEPQELGELPLTGAFTGKWPLIGAAALALLVLAGLAWSLRQRRTTK